MACCSDPKPGAKGGGSCCGGSRPFPWMSVLLDPAIARMFLLRFWPALLKGAAAGCLASLAALNLGEGLGALGPLLGGPWLYFHAAAVFPSAILGALVLSLGRAQEAPKSWLTLSARALAPLALGGLLNGFLDRGPASLLVFPLLGLPTLWLAWGIFVYTPSTKPRSRAGR